MTLLALWVDFTEIEAQCSTWMSHFTGENMTKAMVFYSAQQMKGTDNLKYNMGAGELVLHTLCLGLAVWK